MFILIVLWDGMCAFILNMLRIIKQQQHRTLQLFKMSTRRQSYLFPLLWNYLVTYNHKFPPVFALSYHKSFLIICYMN